MNKRFWGFILVYGAIGTAIFSTRFFELSLPATAIIAALGVIVIPVAERLEKVVDRRRQLQQKESRADRLAKQVRARSDEFRLDFFGVNELSQALIDNDVNLSTFPVFEFTVRQYHDELPDYQQNILLVILLCRQVMTESDSLTRTKLRSRIGELLSGFDLDSPDPPTTELLGAYEHSKPVIETGENDTMIDILNTSPIKPRETALELAKDFGTNQQLAILLFNDKEKAEELRRTLGRLVARGKLSSQNVSREAARRIKEDMERKGGSSTKFIIFSQLLHHNEDVEAKIESFPFFRVGTRETGSGFPEEIEFMRIYILYPEFDYGSPRNFFEQEVSPVLPDDQDEGSFIAVMPLELAELEIYPEIDELDGFISGKFAALNFLKTGASEDLSEILTQRLTSEIEVSELLATLPFNVLVPELKEREKEIIIDNYDELKEEFGVTELFDWEDVDSNKLGRRLASFDPNESVEHWAEIADEIVDRAQLYSEATFGSE